MRRDEAASGASEGARRHVTTQVPDMWFYAMGVNPLNNKLWDIHSFALIQ